MYSNKYLIKELEKTDKSPEELEEIFDKINFSTLEPASEPFTIDDVDEYLSLGIGISEKKKHQIFSLKEAIESDVAVEICEYVKCKMFPDSKRSDSKFDNVFVFTKKFELADGVTATVSGNCSHGVSYGGWNFYYEKNAYAVKKPEDFQFGIADAQRDMLRKIAFLWDSKNASFCNEYEVLLNPAKFSASEQDRFDAENPCKFLSIYMKVKFTEK